jgi:hypothetical protein
VEIPPDSAGNGAGSLPGELPAPLPAALSAPTQQARERLGRPLAINQAAELIGCSPWTVRQRLVPQGLPVFRSAASGKLIFYEAQVIRWIEKQQERRNKRR